MREFLSEYSYFFLRIWRICGKYLSVFGECAESIKAYMENTVNVGLFAVHKIVSEYVESFNRIRRICRKNLCVYGENAKSLSAYFLTMTRDIKVRISKLFIKRIQFFLDTFYLHYIG
jgi:hypothetical protein